MNYAFDISGRLIASIRSYQDWRARDGIFAKLMRWIALARYLMWTIITGSDISPLARLGSGLMLPHPNGVVVHRDAVIGDECMIMQQATIGQLADGAAPVLGSRVYVGAGAKILGARVIGDDARIGANSVVLCDVPDGCTAVGAPARVIRRG